ncbi:MAG: 4-(cytidine 5'-diphospho)-2-C-methyl-D-erythritol kinase [Planctomycetes bacterium]|nr:4-(cytidine 5'-diphospho)-2-C-methyl-D-erythritol kinase [Planctomycetota bacterium]
MRIETSADGRVRVEAPAKLNLYLEVLGKRPDGYHELETVMLAVSLADTLELERLPDGGSAGDVVRVTCDRADLSCDDSNLVTRAARLLAAECGAGAAARDGAGAVRAAARGGVAIRLTKRIPMGAGMGGGSSDAAATLAGLDRLWGLGLSRDRLSELGARLGSDISFFFFGPLAVCRGRGERVEPLPAPAVPFHFVVVWPDQAVPTPQVYRSLKLGAGAPRRGVEAVAQALAAGSAEALGESLFNRLEASVDALHPRLAAAREALARLGFAGTRTTGSGSAFYGVCRSAAEAELLEREARGLGLGQVYRVTSELR